MKNKEIAIRIDINDLSEFYNEYNNTELSSNFVEYIDREIRKSKGTEKITMNVNLFVEISEDQKATVISTIHRHYGHVVKDLLLHERYQNIKNTILMVIGILVVIFADFSRVLERAFVYDLIIIVGTFAMLEALTDIVFADAVRRLKLKRARQLSKSRIIFSIKQESKKAEK